MFVFLKKQPSPRRLGAQKRQFVTGSCEFMFPRSSNFKGMYFFGGGNIGEVFKLETQIPLEIELRENIFFEGRANFSKTRWSLPVFWGTGNIFPRLGGVFHCEWYFSKCFMTCSRCLQTYGATFGTGGKTKI